MEPHAPPPPDLHAALEAVLMVAAAPVHEAELARTLDVPAHEARRGLEYLKAEYDFPVDVRISLEDVGGPSAGTMFALAVIDYKIATYGGACGT